MAKKGNRTIVKMKSSESGHMYYTEKNRRNDTARMELMKYDPLVRKHVMYREAKSVYHRGVAQVAEQRPPNP